MCIHTSMHNVVTVSTISSEYTQWPHIWGIMSLCSTGWVSCDNQKGAYWPATTDHFNPVLQSVNLDHMQLVVKAWAAWLLLSMALNSVYTIMHLLLFFDRLQHLISTMSWLYSVIEILKKDKYYFWQCGLTSDCCLFNLRSATHSAY